MTSAAGIPEAVYVGDLNERRVPLNGFPSSSNPRSAAFFFMRHFRISTLLPRETRRCTRAHADKDTAEPATAHAHAQLHARTRTRTQARTRSHRTCQGTQTGARHIQYVARENIPLIKIK